MDVLSTGCWWFWPQPFPGENYGNWNPENILKTHRTPINQVLASANMMTPAWTRSIGPAERHPLHKRSVLGSHDLWRCSGTTRLNLRPACAPCHLCCIIHEYSTSWHLTHTSFFLFIGLESLVAAHRTTSDRFRKAVSNSWWLVLFYKFPVGSLNFCQIYSMAACCDLHLTLSSAVFKTRFHVLLPSFLQDHIGLAMVQVIVAVHV